MSPAPDHETESFLADLDRAIDETDIGLVTAERTLPLSRRVSIRDLRRRGPRRTVNNIGMMSLVEEDGVLFWHSGSGFRQRAYGSARRARRASGRVLRRLKFETLEPNRVIEALESLDHKLTPQRGLLRRWHSATEAEEAAPFKRGRVLLLIHGTFSNNDHLVSQITSTGEGRRFFRRALKKYRQVLSFDHATLSVSPSLNALDLERLFKDSQATVDIVCHSRGGLVTRWWLETLNKLPSRSGRAVLVGSPLAGTNLAAPPRLRDAMDLLTNILRNVGSDVRAPGGSGLVLSVVALLARMAISVTAAVTDVVSQSPILDAGVAIVPGLEAQSRVGNNPGLVRLRRAGLVPTPDYFGVTSHFAPTRPGWRFWRIFNELGYRAWGHAVKPIFDGPNDLVVDTTSMTDLAAETDISGTDARGRERVKAFRKNGTVHHLNYFQQKATIEFLESTLEV